MALPISLPCNHACPAGEHVEAWLAEAQAGRYRAAWETLVRDNPLPAVHGRVCYHPCEDACNRTHVDEAVSIHAVGAGRRLTTSEHAPGVQRGELHVIGRRNLDAKASWSAMTKLSASLESSSTFVNHALDEPGAVGAVLR